jgi:hypothetical protein
MEYKMKLYLIPLLSFLLMGAACNPGKPKDPCADRPIYKPYSIDVPPRPVLTSDKPLTSDGLVVRAVQEDLSLLSEYAQKLENLIKSLPSDLSIKQ